MNFSSLPYAVLILLLELAAGSVVVLTAFDARGQVTQGYVKAGALTVVPLGMLAAWTVFTIGPSEELDGYRLNAEWLDAARIAVLVFAVLVVVHLIATLRERRRGALILGATAGCCGALALVAVGIVIAPPAWSTVGIVASLLVGAAVLGSALMAMMWGHWYLTSGRLPKEPMEEMTLIVLGAVGLQVLLVAVAVWLPAREVPLSEGSIGVGLSENPAFWLRVAVGLAFPGLLCWLAWRSARIRGMMSATGLLYLALGALLAGEVLARGLLFMTGRVV